MVQSLLYLLPTDETIKHIFQSESELALAGENLVPRTPERD